jgi:hypothetical protein
MTTGYQPPKKHCRIPQDTATSRFEPPNLPPRARQRDKFAISARQGSGKVARLTVLKAEFVSLIRSQGAFYCCGAQFLLLCTAAKPIDLFMEEASKIGGHVLNANFFNPFIPKLWPLA